jgi:hypothetical protein
MSIFYRRDLVTDQKLEKRLETEADLVGGKIPLGQLPNEVATKEYVDQAIGGGGNSLIPLFVVVNTDGNIAYSNDGESWTDGQRLTYDGNDLNVERVSIAKDYIIYLGGIPQNNERLYYASSYEIPETQLISFPSTYLGFEGTFGWEDIKFGGQYTVAVGKFTLTGSESQSLPVFAYTSNGLSWSLGDVNPSYYDFASSASFKSVDYNGVGWLFVSSMFSPNEEIIEGAEGTGAFFITNIMEQLSEGNFIYTPVESESSELVNWNTDSVVWTGNRWWLRDSSSDETNSLGYLVSSGANPLTSTWTLVNPFPALLAAGLGESEEFYEDAGGTIYGTHWFVAANGQGQVVASSDGGQTWVTSVPKPYIEIVSSIDNNVESTISFGESNSPYMSQKIVISNAVPSSFNGTFYVNTDSSKLYTDVTLETPFDTSEMDEFVSATATLSRGEFIDGLGFGLGKFIAANDDEEIFKSTNLQTWTQVYNSIEGGDFVFWNDIDFNSEWEISSAGPSLGNFTISGSTLSSNEGITITNATNDSADLYIKAGDDLYLEAHDDDLFIRSADDVRIQTEYDFDEGAYGYEWEFTNSGDLIFPDNTVQTTAYVNRDTYGCFHKLANLTAPSADTVYNFNWYTDTNVHESEGVTVTSSNPTQININKSGKYSVFTEMIIKITGVGERNVFVWLAKNGTDIPETGVKVSLRQGGVDNPIFETLSKQWFLEDINANDYIELRYALNRVDLIQLEYTPAQTTPYARPAIPSATITIIGV